MKSSPFLKSLEAISSTLDYEVTNTVSGAVLFLFVREYLLLIKRSDSMSTHKGQIAFLGGHVDKSDIDIKHTALREFEEETYRHSNDLKYLGILPSVTTMKFKIIAPVLFYLDEDPVNFLSQIKSNGEWSEAICVDYFELMKSGYWVSAKVKNNEFQHDIFFRTLNKDKLVSTMDTPLEDHVLWGATAKMIWNFHYNLWSKK